MNREDIHKLLGGYATGTLTPEEQQILFEAALEDQALFEALAREQVLRDHLRDPAAKAQLLAALDDQPAPWWREWLRPAAAAVAMAGLVIISIVALRQKPRATAELAVLKPPAGMTAPAPAPLPVQPAGLAEPKPAAPTQPATPPERSAKPATILADRPVDAIRDKREEPRESDTKDAAKLKKDAAPKEENPQPVVAPAAAGPPAQAQAEVPPAAPPSVAPAGQQGSRAPAASPMFQAAEPERAKRGGAGVGGSAPQPVKSAPALAANAVEALADAARARALFFQTANPAELDAAARQQGGGEARTKTTSADNAAIRRSAGLLMTRVAATPAQAGVNPGVRYSFSKKSPDGVWVPAAPMELTAGDSLIVTFTPNQPGRLVVMGEDDRVLISANVQPMRSYATTALQPGEKKLTVVFTRQSQSAAAFNTVANLIEQTASDGTYVVGNPAAQTVTFPIAINYR